MADVRLYSLAGCHLCEDAREVVREACSEAGAEWVEVDISADADAAAAYGEMVPVLVVDGQVAGYWRLDPARVRAALGI
jgi:glutaredoxin